MIYFFHVLLMLIITTESDEEVYKAVIEDRFPIADYEDAPLPEHLPVVCIYYFKLQFV